MLTPSLCNLWSNYSLHLLEMPQQLLYKILITETLWAIQTRRRALVNSDSESLQSIEHTKLQLFISSTRRLMACSSVKSVSTPVAETKPSHRAQYCHQKSAGKKWEQLCLQEFEHSALRFSHPLNADFRGCRSILSCFKFVETALLIRCQRCGSLSTRPQLREAREGVRVTT